MLESTEWVSPKQTPSPQPFNQRERRKILERLVRLTQQQKESVMEIFKKQNKKEQLADGLHLIDYEQLKIENRL